MLIPLQAVKQLKNQALREKCPHFSAPGLSKPPYSVQLWENTDQKNVFGQFLSGETLRIFQQNLISARNQNIATSRPTEVTLSRIIAKNLKGNQSLNVLFYLNFGFELSRRTRADFYQQQMSAQCNETQSCRDLGFQVEILLIETDSSLHDFLLQLLNMICSGGIHLHNYFSGKMKLKTRQKES